MAIQTLATKTFVTNLRIEGSWGATDVGEHESTMELRANDGTDWIEWDIPGLDEYVEIGLWFDEDGKTLTDYDGVMSIPKEALDLIEEAGFIVPPEFRE